MITHMRVDTRSNDFPQLAATMTNEVNKIVDRHSGTLVKIVRAKAPIGKRFFVDTKGRKHPGILKGSVGRRKLGRGKYIVEVGAEYAIYVDRGTRYMRAQPFWRDSIREVRMLIRNDLRTVFRRG